MDSATFIVNIIRKSVHVLVKRTHENPDLAIQDDDVTSSLCSAVEAILLNGQEELGYRKMLNKFGIGSTRQPYECCFWEYLQHYLPRQTCDMIMNSRIQEKRTPIGCCRVWVRVALNEATICNYLESMRFDIERTNRFYKSTALIRDADRMEAALGLLRMAASECTFNLDCMGWELNSWNMSTALSLANVHYVVPTVTPLRPHSSTDASPVITRQRCSPETHRPPSISSPEPIREAPETPTETENVGASPEERDETPKSSSPSSSESGVPENEVTLKSPEADPSPEQAKENSDINDNVDRPPIFTTIDTMIKGPSDKFESSPRETPSPVHTVGSETQTPNSSPIESEVHLPQPSSSGSGNNQILSAMQVADELPASPSRFAPISTSSMTPEAVVSEAVRRGLLLSPPEMPISETYLETLIHAVEEQRRFEREEVIESLLERKCLRNSPVLTDDTSANSSWDKNVGNSSTPLSASDTAPTSSPPVMLGTGEEEEQLDDDDEFAVFPRRRTRLESSGDYSSLMASTSAPDLASATSTDGAPQMSEIEEVNFLHRAVEGESTSLSSSWDRTRRTTNEHSKASNRRDRVPTVTKSRSPLPDGMLERLASTLSVGRRGSASSMLSRISNGLWQSAVRLRSGSTNNDKSGSDGEGWEVIGEEFTEAKNIRYSRLMDIYPGAEQVPDPQYDSRDTNCANCRGHIIGQHRKLDYYDGRWYCSSCHDGAMSILPRRVIFDWDFSQKPVSNETKVCLTRLFLQPNIDVMKTNPELYTISPELCEVTKVRRQLAFLWQYVAECSSGISRDMNRMMIPRERLIATIPEIHLYSLEDLTLVHNGGALLKLVHNVLKVGLTHVWKCSECQTSRPHFCDRCGGRIPLYELDIYVMCLTATCDSVVHKRCFAQHPDDFLCYVCTRKMENKVPLHESYDAVFLDHP